MMQRTPGASRSAPRTRACCTSVRSEEHTSELQSRPHLVCRLLLEKKKTNKHTQRTNHKLTTPDSSVYQAHPATPRPLPLTRPLHRPSSRAAVSLPTEPSTPGSYRR